MFKLLLYYDPQSRALEMVSTMKKLGVDVAWHAQPTSVISQVLEFNADYVIMQAYPDPEVVFDLSNKLAHLAKSPDVILLKNKDLELDPAQIMKNNVAKVFQEPIDIYKAMAYLIENQGHDADEVFAKRLEQKTGSSSKIGRKVPDKFQDRDYSSSLVGFDGSGGEESFDLNKVNDAKKKLAEAPVDTKAESDRDRFLKALLKPDPS